MLVPPDKAAVNYSCRPRGFPERATSLSLGAAGHHRLRPSGGTVVITNPSLKEMDNFFRSGLSVLALQILFGRRVFLVVDFMGFCGRRWHSWSWVMLSFLVYCFDGERGDMGQVAPFWLEPVTPTVSSQSHGTHWMPG